MSILSDLGAFLLGISHKTLTFLISTVRALEANPEVQDIATQEVAAVESAVLTGVTTGSPAAGAAKFALAQTGVIAKLEAAGLPVVMNQVNLAIESAVANLKAATPTVATVDSTPPVVASIPPIA